MVYIPLLPPGGVRCACKPTAESVSMLPLNCQRGNERHFRWGCSQTAHEDDSHRLVRSSLVQKFYSSGIEVVVGTDYQ